MLKILDSKWKCGAIPALLIHLSIGSVYCWSLLKESIANEMSISVESIEFAFTLAIFFLGMSAAFGGRLVEKNVKRSSIISTISFSTGLLLSIVMIETKSIIGFYLTYGVLMGIGLGIGYLSPVKTLILWFKNNPGLATGLAIMGFGLSKSIFSPYIEWCNEEYGIITTLWTMAVFSLCSMTIASWYIKKPENSEQTGEVTMSFRDSIETITNLTYIKIWIMFFLNITCGLVIISFEKPISLEIGVQAGYIGILAAGSAIFNALGRFGYATVSDAVTDKIKIYTVIFSSCLISLGLMNFSNSSVILWIILLMTINLGYGGGFSCLPILLKNIFGMKNLSTIHGFALSAWAWASVAAYIITQVFIYNLGYDSSDVLIILGILYAIALSISMSIQNENNNIDSSNN